MKKLMIAAAAIVCAAAVQAATVNWDFQTTTASYAGNSSDLASGLTAYLVCYSDDYYGGGEEFGVSQAALLSALGQGKSITDAAGDYLIGPGQTIGDTGLINGKVSFDFDALSDGEGAVSAYMVIVDTDKVYIGNDKWYEENALAPGTGLFDPTTATTKDFISGSTYSDAGWYTVPEPTSGLLLLLGVAGLALKRKRA